jgi:Peptidase family M1 domain
MRPYAMAALSLVMWAALAVAGPDAPAEPLGGVPPTVAAVAKDVASPVLDAAGVDASGRSFNSGHLTLSFQRGALYPVMAGTRPIGAYFVGTATLTWVSKDPLEAAVYRTNVDRAGGSVASDGTFTEPVESGLIVMSGGVGRFFGDAAKSDASVAAAKHAFAAHLERFSHDYGVRYPQILPQALLDGPADPVVVAELRGAKHDFQYVYDDLRNHDEWLAVMRTSRSDLAFEKNSRYPDVLSLQPIGRSRLETAPRRFMLTALDVTVVNPAGLSAELTTRETFQALVPVRILDLALWSRIAGTVGLGGQWAQNEVTLRSVTLDGKALPFSHVDGDLLVELPRPLAPGETATLEFAIDGDVLFRPGGDSYWTLPTAPWFASPNRVDTEYMTYHAVVKVPKPFVSFSCGVTVRRWEEGGMACAEFREDKPIQIPAILAGRYTTVQDTRNGLTVSVSSYAGANPRAAKKLINDIFALIGFYTPYLGAYPFSEMKVIEINSYGFGQAPSGMIFITKEAFAPLQDETTRLFSQGINARLAHEMAHTWWGHVAKLGAPQEQWLSESLAEFYSAVAISHLWRTSEYERAIDDWKTMSRFVKDHATVLTANELSGPDAFRDRYALLYGKGPIVLAALRKALGDAAFFTICKSYLKTFNFRYAETRDFIGLTNFVAKKDYTPWFNRYLLGTDWPKE